MLNGGNSFLNLFSLGVLFLSANALISVHNQHTNRLTDRQTQYTSSKIYPDQMNGIVSMTKNKRRKTFFWLLGKTHTVVNSFFFFLSLSHLKAISDKKKKGRKRTEGEAEEEEGLLTIYQWQNCSNRGKTGTQLEFANQQIVIDYRK